MDFHTFQAFPVPSSASPFPLLLPLVYLALSISLPPPHNPHKRSLSPKVRQPRRCSAAPRNRSEHPKLRKTKNGPAIKRAYFLICFFWPGVRSILPRSGVCNLFRFSYFCLFILSSRDIKDAIPILQEYYGQVMPQSRFGIGAPCIALPPGWLRRFVKCRTPAMNNGSNGSCNATEGKGYE